MMARTVAAVARDMKLTAWQVYQAVQSGELGASKIEGRLYITDNDLSAWIEAHRIEAER